MIFKIFITLFLICSFSFAGQKIKILNKDLIINSSVSNVQGLSISIIEDSVIWFRTNDLIMEPKVRIQISHLSSKNLTFKYKDEIIHLQKSSNQYYTQMYFHLFDFEKINVLENNQLIGSINIERSKKSHSNAIVQDYSCEKYNISISGTDNEFFSVGCKTLKLGKIGEETRLVKVYWKSPLFEKTNSVAHFISEDPVIVESRDREGKLRKITFTGDIPKRFHRLNIAYGFGPYAFETRFEGQKSDNNTDQVDVPIAPALMLYFNFNLSPDDSIRGFDAVVFKDSIFNNMGAYYARNFFYLDNKQFSLTSLIGVQHLYFDFDGDKKIVNKPIFPQGLEFTYKNSFGLEGYTLGAGAFISPSDSYDYQNLWVRFGKNIFWELNYIYWGEDEFSAKMWGISAGFFFGSFL